MPVDLRALPENVAPPSPPGKGRWLLLVLLWALLGGSLVVLLWPADQSRTSAWFWCCAVVFPVITGVLLFALRLLAYERQQHFAQGWNQRRGELEQALIQRGQRAIAVLASSYCSPAGNNRLAQALRNGCKPLQPVYLRALGTTVRLSQLPDPLSPGVAQTYTQRLQRYVRQVMRGLDEDLQRLGRTTPVRVRIKHNQVLTDAEVLSVWEACVGEHLLVEQVLFAGQDDGLLWLDTWLDAPEAVAMVLSLEVNVFAQPTDGQAESVSAVLLAQAQCCARHKVEPLAWVHRPVPMTPDLNALQDVLRWGRVEQGGEQCFAWQTQVPSDYLRDVSIAMDNAGCSLDIERCQQLDDAFGLPGHAVGNVALIVASEHAASQGQAQLLMLLDASPQWCVVRSA